MAEKQLDKLVANNIHSLEDYRLNRELLILDFLKKDSAIDVAPGVTPLADGDSVPFLDSSHSISTPRSVKWIRTTIVGGRLTSIGGALIRTDLSIANKTSTTLDVLSSSGDDITLPAADGTYAGLMTAANVNKLTTIEAYADVTDKENVATAIMASPIKSTPTGADYIAIVDSVGTVLSRVLWSNLAQSSTIGTQIAHTFPVGATIKPTLTGWVRTKADSVDNAGTVGVVISVIDADHFKYIVEGIIPGSYTIGANYFLSTTTLGGVMIVDGTESWLIGQVIEYIGTGIAEGLYVQIGVGQEISELTLIDKYVSAVAFNATTRVLTISRTGGLADLTATITNTDTLDSVVARNNVTSLGATFGGTLATNIITSSSVSTPVLKLTSGAATDYIWKCTNVDGSGAWSPATASNVYKGTWNAATNIPSLVDGTGTAGWYYRVTTTGTWNGITFTVGDDVIYNGLVWQRIPTVSYALVPATAVLLGGVKIGTGVTVQLDGTISVSTNYQAPLTGTGLVYSTAGVITYDTNTYATQTWVGSNYSALGHTHAYVPTTRNINTTQSLTGGGNLTADRTLSLVNDSATPGSYFSYSTNAVGIKGWFANLWLPTTSGIQYTGGYVAIGSFDPLFPLHLQIDKASGFVASINNINSTTGDGLVVSAQGTSFEVRDKANLANPAFQILGDGSVKWQLAPLAVKTFSIYYDTATKQLSYGATPTLSSLGGIGLTSLHATSPILYDNTTGYFSMATNAYAPYGTVTFPGFGTSHGTASYGDHAHGQITSVGAIGAISGLPIITTTAGVLTVGTFGTVAGSFCAGDDVRLSNTRVPTAHNLVDTVNHPVSGLTTGHFLKALSATTYGFVAHGLTYTDVAAAPASGSVNYIWNQTALAQAGGLNVSGTGTFGSFIAATTGKFSTLGDTYIPYNVAGTGLVSSEIYMSAGTVRMFADKFMFTTNGWMSWGLAHGNGYLWYATNEAIIGALSGSSLTLTSNGSAYMSIDTTGNVSLLGYTSAIPRLLSVDGAGKITVIADGTTGQFLSTNGSGGYSWATVVSSTGGTVTSIATNVGLSGGPITGSGTISLALNNLAEKATTLLATDRLVGVSGSVHFAKTISTIPLSIFSNDSGWTANTGTVTSVAAGAGMNFTTFSTSGSVVMGNTTAVSTVSNGTPTGTTHSHVLDLSGRSVTGQFSITGGGTLAADRLFSLVGDAAIPGNTMYYGTNSTGTRGWYSYGNQTINLTGHVQGSGTTSISTTIQSNVVTLAMMATMSTNSFLGRLTAGPGNVEVLTVGNVQGMLGLQSAAYTLSTAYALSGHTHDYSLVYEPLITPKLPGHLKWTGSAWLFMNETYSLSDHTHSIYQPLDADLTSIAGLISTTGLLRKTAADTWILDTVAYTASTITIGTQHSITGGGDLSANRTLNLVGDTATPGNSMLYGTNSSGVRGWYAQPSLQTITLTGHINGSGTGSFATTIQPNVVALSMMATIATASFLGRLTTGPGNVEVLTVLNVQSMLGLGTAAYVATGTFAPAVHTHDFSLVYEPLIPKSVGYAKWTGTAWTFLNETYSLSIHTHSGVYQPLDGDLTSIAGIVGTSGFLCKTAVDTWSLDPTVYANSTTTITGQNSITGGGNLTTSRVLNLVGDVAAPGNLMLYGTNGTGTRGWYAIPTFTDTNNYTTVLTFGASTGTLTLSRSGLTDLTTSLNGRFLVTPILATDTVPYWTGTAFADSSITRTSSLVNIHGNAFIFSTSGALVWGGATAAGVLWYSGATVQIGSATGSTTTILSGGNARLTFAADSTRIHDLSSTGTRLVIASSLGVVGTVVDGTAGQVLMTNGAGGYYFAPAGSGADGNSYPTSMSITGNDLSLFSTNGMPTIVTTLLAGNGTAVTASHSDHNHSGTYQLHDADLDAIAAITSTTGLLRKTAADTWDLDISAYALNTITITGQHSITGGGNLTTNKVLNLVGDVAIPGLSMFYGTNSSGVRGWYATVVDPNYYATSLAFGTTTGDLVLSGNGTSPLTKNLDGRYLIIPTITTNTVPYWNGSTLINSAITRTANTTSIYGDAFVFASLTGSMLWGNNTAYGYLGYNGTTVEMGALSGSTTLTLKVNGSTAAEFTGSTTAILSLSSVKPRMVVASTTGYLSGIADGTAGQVLTTNGTGGYSFTTVGGSIADGNFYPTAMSITGNDLSLTSSNGMPTVTFTVLAGNGTATTAAHSDHSHTYADMVVDGDFTAPGIMVRGALPGSYSIIADNSIGWNSASAKAHVAVSLGVATNGLSLGVDPSLQVLSLGIASNITTGALTSSDWALFNGKISSINKSMVEGVLTGAITSHSHAFITHSLQTGHTDVNIPGVLDISYANKGLYWTGSNWGIGTPWTGMGYITGITKANVEAVLTGDISTHTHSTYALSGHNHLGTYQPLHANLTSLSNLIYASTAFVKMTGINTFSLDTTVYSVSEHTHAGLYQPLITPAALSKANDTNVTLTLTGTPLTALLQDVTITAGWQGTLADIRIASAGTWNGKQDGHANLTSVSGLSYVSPSFVKMTGVNTFSLDTNTYSITGHTHTGVALTKTNDTNVTLTLEGSPNTALLAATSLTLGWTGTLADIRIASAGAWNGKQSGHANLDSLSTLSYSSTAFVKMSAIGTFVLDTNTYVTGTPWTGMGYVTGTPWTGMGYEVTTNRVVSISALSTDIQYPSAKLLYDQLALKQPVGNYVTGTPWTSMGYATGGPFQPLATNLTSLSNLSFSSTAFVKMTGINTFTLDTTVYVTGTPWTSMGYITNLASGNGNTLGISNAGGVPTYTPITTYPTSGSLALTHSGQVYSFVTGFGYLTSITKSQVETVLTGAISTHSHAFLPHNIQSHSDVYIPVALDASYANRALYWTGGSWGIGTPWTGLGYMTSIPVATSTTLGGVKIGSSGLGGTTIDVSLSAGQIAYVSLNSTAVGAALPAAGVGVLGGIKTGFTAVAGTVPLQTSGDAGFVSISKAYIEGMLTGAISSHTHSYAPISGSTNYIQNQYAAAQSSSNLWVSGNIQGNEVYRGSSRKLKNNIEIFDFDAMGFLNDVEIMRYNLKTDNSFGIGFIAEVTHPWLSGDEQISHAFGNHLGILTKAIQEEDTKIKQLEKRVSDLEQQLKMI